MLTGRGKKRVIRFDCHIQTELYVKRKHVKMGSNYPLNINYDYLIKIISKIIIKFLPSICFVYFVLR